MKNQNRKKGLIAGSVAVILAIFVAAFFWLNPSTNTNTASTPQSTTSQTVATYQVSQDEKDYLKNKFDGLTATNRDTIAYLYLPETNIDYPIVQTDNNEHYLDYTFEGEHVPLLGAIFMDYENKSNFSDELTWLFGHARGGGVDEKMFNHVNKFEDQTYFDNHKYLVVETPERKYYYEAAFLIIVPETTAFYRTSFDSKQDFKEQLTAVSEDAVTKNTNVKISEDDRYLVLSTCREDDVTIRTNLYLRQIPDSELTAFLQEHGDGLTYQTNNGRAE